MDVLEDIDFLGEKALGDREGIICTNQSVSSFRRQRSRRFEERLGEEVEIAVHRADDLPPGCRVPRNLRPGVEANGIRDEKRPGLSGSQIVVSAIGRNFFPDQLVEHQALLGSGPGIVRRG